MSRLVQGLAAVAVLVAGVGVAYVLMATSATARRRPLRIVPRDVEVLAVEVGPRAVRVPAMGTVEADRSVSLQPEVGGRVVEVSDELTPGGTFAAGDLILRIDPRDYEFAVAQQEAGVAQAVLALKEERGRQTSAQLEEKITGGRPGAGPEARALRLREPHVAAAEAALAAAREQLAQAKLNLRRTGLRAPLACMVLDEAVEVGQTLSPQAPVVTLVGTERFRVRVSVPVERLAQIELPGEDRPGSPARVIHEVGDAAPLVREGRVMRLLGNLDPQGRMAQLLVAVNEPLQGARPLLLGAYVRVEIEGPGFPAAAEIPREALREGDVVWLMDKDDRLAIRPVEVLWRRPETVLVGGGLRAGERVVLTALSMPVPGMGLRLALASETNAAAGEASP